jgi:hypothetical protein
MSTDEIPCSVDGCDRYVRRSWHTLCSGHWQRVKNTGGAGSPTFQTGIYPAPAFPLPMWDEITSYSDRYGCTYLEWFNRHIESSNDPDDCWVWTGGDEIPAEFKTSGYGFMFVGDRRFRVHRISYSIYRSDIPDGLVLDHLCNNKICCNAWHLEPVTNSENIRRANEYSRAQRETRKAKGRIHPEHSTQRCGYILRFRKCENLAEYDRKYCEDHRGHRRKRKRIRKSREVDAA